LTVARPGTCGHKCRTRGFALVAVGGVLGKACSLVP